MGALLDRIGSPSDLKGLAEKELEPLAEELRSFIIETVSKTGGHLAANLGVVELTVALLHVFDPPADKILWDVGHQTYAYKVLTGRKERFGSLRQANGLSGFQKREESEYDAFGAGHAGTALSAALGMAVARDRRGARSHVVAVMGDAAAGNGITLEALNNVGLTTSRLIVVLNDNEMSISANVGATSRYFGSLLANPKYNRWKRSVESVATRMKMGWLRSGYYRIEEAIKSLFLRSIVFEEFGLRYIGPIDGHNISSLIDALSIARDSSKPILLHVSTRKGKGYSFAEQLPEKWHGTTAFDIASGRGLATGTATSYSSVFGSTIEKLAAEDERIVAITAAMAAGTGLAGFARRFPERFFDVGIAEEHGVVFAAGLAAEGFVPVFAVYSTFLQRAIDCVIHDVCLQKLPVILCLDRAGVVGDDGPTHHGVFDIALLRPIPGLVIMQPKDEAELAAMLLTATRLAKPVAIRYPRGAGPGVAVPKRLEPIEEGKAEVIRPGRDVQIWALGDMVAAACRAADLLAGDGVSAGVVNARFVRPLDGTLLAEQARDARVVVTMENGVVAGGFGAGVGEFLLSCGAMCRVVTVGWPHRFVPQGTPSSLFEACGLTPEAVRAAVVSALSDLAVAGSPVGNAG